jgi:hypothetical protein
MDYILTRFAELYESWLFLSTPLFLLVGFGMAFYGLIVSRTVAYLIGFFWGALLGMGGGYYFGEQSGAFLGALVLGCIGGGMFLWSAINLPKIIGFFAGYLPIFLLVQPEGAGAHLVPLLGGLAGGWLGGFVNRTFIIFTSALSGAWMMTAATVRFYGWMHTSFYGNVLDAINQFALLAAVLFSSLMLLGIFNQYGLVKIFKPMTKRVRTAAEDYNLGLDVRERGTDALLLYAFKKKTLRKTSPGYCRIHAYASWMLAIICLCVGPVLIYLAYNQESIHAPSLVTGWIYFKGVLAFFMGGYFGVAFFQAVRSLGGEAVPDWSVRVTFSGGILIGALWLFGALVPLAHGWFWGDIVLAVPIFFTIYLQYRYDRKFEPGAVDQLCLQSATSGKI